MGLSCFLIVRRHVGEMFKLRLALFFSPQQSFIIFIRVVTALLSLSEFILKYVQ
ncbi:hypothetical protein ACHAXS_001371 [Conticribra weissflogii]